MDRIPVGYQMKAAVDLKIDDVIYTEGRIFDVWTTDEDEEWGDPRAGKSYMIPSVVYIIPSVVENEYLEQRIPATAYIRVLRYAKVKDSKRLRKGIFG